MRVYLLAIGLAAAVTTAAAQQSSTKPSRWVAPGTPGSPINGELFHAQVLLDAAGFSPGVIDGKKGTSLTQAIKGFQQANGLQASGKLDGPTRTALLRQNRQSTVYEKLTGDEIGRAHV